MKRSAKVKASSMIKDAVYTAVGEVLPHYYKIDSSGRLFRIYAGYDIDQTTYNPVMSTFNTIIQLRFTRVSKRKERMLLDKWKRDKAWLEGRTFREKKSI